MESAEPGRSSSSYVIVDLDLEKGADAVDLDAPVDGIGIVSRRGGCVVGFALEHTGQRRRFEPHEIHAWADPDPVTPMPDGDPRAPAPTVTAAICTHDRPDVLDACLRSLLGQTDPPEEILVVDNAPSDDRSAVVVASLLDRAGGRLRRVVEDCPGLDVARNLAVRESSTEVIAFVDDDVIVDPHWCAAQRAAWQRHPDAGAVTGQILPHKLETPAQVAFELRGGFRGGNHELRWSGMDEPGNPVYPYGPGMFGSGANLAVRRTVAVSLGGFDEALDTGAPLPGGGDLDLLHRVIRAGHAVVYDPRAVVFHRHRRGLAELRSQYESWGRSLTAWVAKVHHADREGRPKLRLLVRWFVRSRAGELSRGSRSGGSAVRMAAAAELRGAALGLLGTYRRSRRRTGRLRRRHGRPRIAILPWGDVIDDYLTPIGLSLDDFADRLDGGWLFGFVEALDRAGVDVVIVCWSAHVDGPTRRIHAPSGTTMWFLPQPKVHRLLRRAVDQPYAWSGRAAAGTRSGWRRHRASIAREMLPYLATDPRSLAGVLRREGVQTVLCQEYEEGRFDVCVILGRLLRIPVFATFQGSDHTRTHVERAVRRHTVRAAAGFVISAPTEVQRVCTTYSVDPRAISTAPNPFDPAALPPYDRGRARRALGLDPDTRVAVWHGRVDIGPKGIDVLIEAWREVTARATCDVRLLLLGTGSGAGWLHDRLDHDGPPGVVWHDEYVLDRSVVSRLLAAGDVYVLPSRQEGFPVAPVEAMASGLPVVATDAPGVRAVVGEGPGAAGIVVAKDDIAALSDALLRYLEDPDLARRAGSSGRRRVSERFSLDAVGVELRGRLVAR